MDLTPARQLRFVGPSTPCGNKNIENMSNPFRQVSSRRLPAFPGTKRVTSARQGGQLDNLTADFVKAYLTTHHDVLEEFIGENVAEEMLEEWLNCKKLHQNAVCSRDSMFFKSPVLQDNYSDLHIGKVQEDLLARLNKSQDYLPLVYEFGNVVGTVMRTEMFSLYAVKGKELYLYIQPYDSSKYQLRLSGAVATGTTVSAHVASNRVTMLISDLSTDDRFPRGIGVEGTLINSVLCVPLILPTGDLICILEYGRTWDKHVLSEAELQMAVSSFSWMGLTIYQTQTQRTVRKQAELNDFLLDVSRDMFGDIIELDSLVEKIMVYTKDLIHADRCALFLVDKERQELYANLFDEGETKDGRPVFLEKQLRFPLSKGIAGLVARTGEIINIPEAYKDPRFNRDIDKQTGYTTRNILCMPISCNSGVIGVVQMVNKLDDVAFTKADEASFKMFALYSALALHYSKLYSELQHKTAQATVAMEMVSYHHRCHDKEIAALRSAIGTTGVPVGVDSFSFYGPRKHEGILEHLVIHMAHNLFGTDAFNMDQLNRFVLTVKRNYRPVSYHNWKHGFNVAHCMYLILRHIQTPKLLSRVWRMALFFGSLCHDVDHRGYNNAFFSKFNQPLATLYPESVMEQHHYAVTVGILQHKECDIFSTFSSEEYKQLLERMKHAILATDLALYFPNQKGLASHLVEGTLDIQNNPTHLEDAIALAMTASDLSAICKPWAVQQTTVADIYEEFYRQGDLEKEMGTQPIPMMDRENKDNLAKDQVGFIEFVCRPCYVTISEIFPETSDLLKGCNDNLEQWELVKEGKAPRS